MVDTEFLEGKDHKVPLTQSQKSHYHLIFQINDHSNNGHLEVAELGRFIDSLGHGFSISELHEMLHEVGIIEDADDTITEATFFEFIRRTVVEDLPASKIPMITSGFHRVCRPLHAHDHHVGDIHAGELAAASSVSTPKGVLPLMRQPTPDTGGPAEELMVVDKEEALQLLENLGFHLDEHTFTEVALLPTLRTATHSRAHLCILCHI